MPVYYDPVLELRSIVNFRDIGGHRTRSGRSVRRGCVYRSGHLAQASEGDLERLRGAGIRCVIDFRTTGDMAGDGGARLPGGARRVHLPMGDPSRAATEIRTLLFDGDRVTMEAQLGDGGAEQMMLDAARALVLERTREYGEMVRTLAAEDALPAIVHCSAGKDRTGWAASLLLLMLDVPEEAIVAHYAESDVHRREVNARMLKSMPEGVDPAWVQPFFECRPAYARASLEAMRGEWGDVDAYLSEGCGVPAPTLEALRLRLLE
jgi:protein-tyrosine phosphatase